MATYAKFCTTPMHAQPLPTTCDQPIPFPFLTSPHSHAALALHYRCVPNRRVPIFDSSCPAKACMIPTIGCLLVFLDLYSIMIMLASMMTGSLFTQNIRGAPSCSVTCTHSVNSVSSVNSLAVNSIILGDKYVVVNVLESTCMRICGQRVAKDEGGEEEQPEKNGEEVARIVLQVPTFGPDFWDNHAERGGKQGDQVLLFHSMGSDVVRCPPRA
ncbi:hypothetical protein EDB86DRAFT_2833655 [Lactarius hatsudake]|nr:hypothetical protein EDB86DRAFT_2833655 [Lactarius hatsudake]